MTLENKIKECCKRLNVSGTFDLEKLKKAYKIRAFETHPDINGEQFEKEFKRIKESYDFLVAYLNDNGGSLDIDFGYLKEGIHEKLQNENRVRLVVDRADYVFLEATSQYPDTLVSTKTMFDLESWSQAHTVLQEIGLHMPTVRQFVDFLKLLDSGKAFNERGHIINPLRLQWLLKKQCGVGFNPDISSPKGKMEYLDAYFKETDGILYMDYNHRMVNGELKPKNSEQLEPYLQLQETERRMGPYVQKIDPSAWLNLSHFIKNPTKQGLPQEDSLEFVNNNGLLFYYYPPRAEKIASFCYTKSDGCLLDFIERQRMFSSSWEVRPCAII